MVTMGIWWIAAPGWALAALAGFGYLRLRRQQRESERNLRRAVDEVEENFHSLLEAAPYAVVLADGDTCAIIECNRRAEELIGLPRSRIIGLPDRELCPPGERDKAGPLSAMVPGCTIDADVRLWGRDGQAVPVSMNARRLSFGHRSLVWAIFRPADADQILLTERTLTDSILETVPALVLVMDSEGRITRFNKACEALSGYTADEVRGRYVWDVLIPPGDAARTREIFLGLVGGAFPSHHEHAWVTKEGQPRVIAWSDNAILDDEGGVRHFIATGIDVTLRKATEEALRRARDEMEKRVVLRTAALRAANDALIQSEARLAEAQRLAHIGGWEWDVDGDRVHWSEEVFRIFGRPLSTQGPTLQAFLEYVHPDDRGDVRTAIDRALAQGEAYSIDHRVVRPDGTSRVVHEHGIVTFDEQGRAIRMTGTVQDITERNSAEEELRRAHAQLEGRVQERTAELRLANQALSFTQFAMDHAADAIFWVGADFRFAYVNEAACRNLGYDRSTLLNMALSDISADFEGSRCCERIEAATTGNTVTFDFSFRRSDGVLLPVEIAANRLEYEGQEYICIFARDITDRRRAEVARRAQLQAERTLSSISSRFVAADDMDKAIEGALMDLRSLLQSKCACLLRVNKETILTESATSCGKASHCWRSGNALALSRLAALRDGEVIVEPENAPEGTAKSVLVPMFAEQALVGILAFESAQTVERWREGDFPLLRVAARVITNALQRHRAELQTMKLLEENRRLARQSLEIQERERAHLARELHDELGQCLTAIRADAQSVCRLSKGKDPRIHESGKAIGEVASRVYEVVRNIMRRLRPEMLDELGLGEALRDIVGQWRTRHADIEWILSISDPLGVLPEAVQITAFRVVQESITNVVKHAQATRVHINVIRGAGGLEVLVRDNGHGERPPGQRGFGLLGMRERVLSAGGRFEISNQPGQGYRIYASFPLCEKEEDLRAG